MTVRTAPPLLWRMSYRFLVAHPWLFFLSILGVALGVAVVVSVDLANSSSRTAFQLSAETVTGKATHQIVGAGDDLDETIYRQLRLQPGFRTFAPIVEGYVTVPSLGGRTFQLLGIDPLVEAPFRPYWEQTSEFDLGAFMARPGAAVLSEYTIHDTGLEYGDSLIVEAGGNRHVIFIMGTVRPADERSKQAMESVFLVDISTAQEILNKPGRLSRIDVLAPEGREGERAIDELRRRLPDGVSLVPADSKTETLRQMTEAFNLNLTALSLLALIVGVFLIYNTMTFAVVQRRPLIGRLRAIGVTRREVGALILTEAVLIGILGTTVGLLLGFVLAKGLVQLVSRTINDLYYVVNVRRVPIEPVTLVKGIVLGTGATFLAALQPAREATLTTISSALSRSYGETRIRSRLRVLAFSGVLVLVVGALLLLIPGPQILSSYAAMLSIILGFALLTPSIVMAIVKVGRPGMGRLFGVLGRMAARSVAVSLSRTSVAIAALMIAIAAAVGVGIMVESFRQTVVTWLDHTLQADIYVQPPSPVARRVGTTLHPEVVERLVSAPGIEAASSVRQLDVPSELGYVELAVIDPGLDQSEAFRYTRGDPKAIWKAFMYCNAVLLSEPFAIRHGLSAGDTVRLSTDRGEQAFPIAAVHYDYSSNRGSVVMSRTTFERYFDDRGLTGVGLFVEPGRDVDSLVVFFQQSLTPIQEVIVRSNRGLRETSLAIFDRTFMITAVLRMLAVVVAFMGVLSALMALQLERSREFAVLRANGLTPGQVWRFVLLQTGLMGLIAGVLSLPLGTILASVLVFVINRRSFGWTLQLDLSPGVFTTAILLAVGAALLAGLYPSYRMSRANPAMALRDE